MGILPCMQSSSMRRFRVRLTGISSTQPGKDQGNPHDYDRCQEGCINPVEERLRNSSPEAGRPDKDFKSDIPGDRCGSYGNCDNKTSKDSYVLDRPQNTGDAPEG